MASISRSILLLLFAALSAYAQFGSNATSLRGKRLCNPLTVTDAHVLTWDAALGCWKAAAGGAGSGTVTSVGLAGTANQVTVTGSSPITGSGSWTLTLPSGLIFPGTVTFTAGTTSVPSFNIPSGVAKTSPAAGDFWNQSGALKFYNGTTTLDVLPPVTVTCSAWSTAAGDTLSTDGAEYSTFASTNAGATETAFAKTCTIPANTFAAGTYVQFRALLASTTSSTAPTRQFRVRLTNVSGTVVVDGLVGTPPSSLSYRASTLNWGCWGTAAAGASVNIACAQEQQAGLNATSTNTGWASTMNTTAAFQAVAATNGSLVFVLTVDLDPDTATGGNMAQLLALKAFVWQ